MTVYNLSKEWCSLHSDLTLAAVQICLTLLLWKIGLSSIPFSQGKSLYVMWEYERKEFSGFLFQVLISHQSAKLIFSFVWKCGVCHLLPSLCTARFLYPATCNMFQIHALVKKKQSNQGQIYDSTTLKFEKSGLRKPKFCKFRT